MRFGGRPKGCFLQPLRPVHDIRTHRDQKERSSERAEGNATAFLHVPVIMIIKIIVNFATPVHRT